MRIAAPLHDIPEAILYVSVTEAHLCCPAHSRALATAWDNV